MNEKTELSDEQRDAEWMRWNLPANASDAMAFYRLSEQNRIRKAFDDGLQRGFALAASPSYKSTKELPALLFDGYYVWNEGLTDAAKRRTSPENVSDVLDAVVRLMRASSSIKEDGERAEPGNYTYVSTQATNCASCGLRKHTPLRVDWMGGYVCLTCIDRVMESIPAAPPLADDNTPIIYDTNDVDEVTLALTGDDGEDDSVTVLRRFAAYVENVWPGKTAKEVLMALEESSPPSPLGDTPEQQEQKR